MSGGAEDVRRAAVDAGWSAGETRALADEIAARRDVRAASIVADLRLELAEARRDRAEARRDREEAARVLAGSTSPSTG